MVPEIGHQSLLLVEVERDSLVVVVGHAVVELQRHLVDRQQPLVERCDGAARAGMGVQHAVRVLAGRWMAEWMTKPAGLTRAAGVSTGSPVELDRTSDEAVISSKSRP